MSHFFLRRSKFLTAYYFLRLLSDFEPQSFWHFSHFNKMPNISISSSFCGMHIAISLFGYISNQIYNFEIIKTKLNGWNYNNLLDFSLQNKLEMVWLFQKILLLVNLRIIFSFLVAVIKRACLKGLHSWFTAMAAKKIRRLF